MPPMTFSSRFIAAQVAGSCRIEGIRVSASQENTMRQVIEGTIDYRAERDRVVARIRAKYLRST